MDFWRRYHANRRRGTPALPSRLSVFNRDFQSLLRRHIRPGMRVLEIGCAPGRHLAWVARRLCARVAGLDYSPDGMDAACRLFDLLGLAADLRCEDLFSTTFAPGQFDVAYSAGLIEHFEDPAPAVRRHVELVRPGGVALIAVPNYSGIYRRVQEWFDPANLRMHNLDIMSRRGMEELAPADLSGEIAAFPAGRLGAWLISFRSRLPGPLALLASGAFHLLGYIQPCRLPGLNSMWVLRIVRRDVPTVCR